MKRRWSAVAACNVTDDKVGVSGNEHCMFTSCSNSRNNVSATNPSTEEEIDVVPVNSEEDSELEYQEKISEATEHLSQVEALLGEKAEELSPVKSQLSVTGN